MDGFIKYKKSFIAIIGLLLISSLNGMEPDKPSKSEEPSAYYLEDPEYVREELKALNNDIKYYEENKEEIVQNISIGYQISMSEALNQYERHLSNLKEEREELLRLLAPENPELSFEEYVKKIE